MTRSTTASRPINRKALVTRHDVLLTQFDGDRPLQVGNGEFAFGMDITGLQTFVPFNTMSQWGWHSSPLPPGQKLSDFQGQVWDTHGRPIRYMMPDPNHPALSAWMAANPHRINLGRIGMNLVRKDGTPGVFSDLTNIHQKLDLWNGTVTSKFNFENEPVQVTTVCHPSMDAIAARIESPLLKEGRLTVFLTCPGNDPLQFANFVGDWKHPGIFEQEAPKEANRLNLVRRMDKDIYHVSLAWSGEASIRPDAKTSPPFTVIKAEYGAGDKWIDVTKQATEAVQNDRLSMRADNSLGDPILGTKKQLKVTYLLGGKEYIASADENDDLMIDPDPSRSQITLQPGIKDDSLSFVCAFSQSALPKVLPNPDEVIAACRKQWPAYWKSGGAIDFSGSTDPRANELERRVVLSQYLMKVNEAGSLPPQESGLVNNGWFGKFHMEMVLWHEAHWALWNRWSELDRSIGIYKYLLKSSLKRAKDQGYLGARWPKCIGPQGQEWPHIIHATLIWQQPHPIFFAELDYRAHPTRKTLEKWMPVVEATADFMASYDFFDAKTHHYVLGPPLTVVSENTDPKTTVDPTFELSYWRFGLRVAEDWRKRLGMPPKQAWEKVLKGLSPLPLQNGVYVLYRGVKDMWTKFNFEHPAITGAFGLLPGDGVDRATMKRTLDKIMQTWDFGRTWGWDYPMLAMCAARLGEPQRAVDFLLTKSVGFQFDDRGLATGGPFPYFPSNGGLLYAVAMMAAGWDGGPSRHAPGFPVDGSWKVRWEDLGRVP